MRANLFPCLVNQQRQVTRHEFIGFRTNRIDALGDIKAIQSYTPMFRCTETGAERAYGFLKPSTDLKALYDTERTYRE